MSVKDLTAQLSAGARPSCDEVEWRLFGVSLAGYNALFSLVLGAIAIVGARFMGRI